MTEPSLDFVSIGRSSVDLYGQQIGGRLEDMGSFSKAVGGCPTNIAIGGARLGLKSAVITRVGDEAMGRFIREQLEREGVDTRGVKTDPERLTALVVLGVRDDKSFPLIFYRTDCADAALDESDIDEALIADAKAVIVTGTHFSRENSDRAQRKAISIAKQHGRKVCFDIDFRPNLWGLAGHGAGEERYMRSETVSRHLQSILADCDLVIGTEEELHIAAGTEDTLEALRVVRALSKATIVLKRGPMGCVVYPDAIPDSIEDGIKGPGFPVEVYNVLGAGDAFFAGFMRGYIRGEGWERAATYANAGGAFAVSRLLCAPEYPTWAELQHFLEHGAASRQLRTDRMLAHIHHATTRRERPDTLRFLSCDHGAQDLVPVAEKLGADPARIPAFKALVVKAALGVAGDRPGYGVFLDGALGREALFAAEASALTVVRQFPHGDAQAFAASPREWPVTQIVKTIANARSDARTKLAGAMPEIAQLSAICRAEGRELMVEALAAEGGTTADLVAQIYAEGIRPDWWLVEAQADAAAWGKLGDVVRQRDPLCQGFIAIARDIASAPGLKAAAREPFLRGVVGGRAVFGDVLSAWLKGDLDDAGAVARLSENFAALAGAFDTAVGASA